MGIHLLLGAPSAAHKGITTIKKPLCGDIQLGITTQLDSAPSAIADKALLGQESFLRQQWGSPHDVHTLGNWSFCCQTIVIQLDSTHKLLPLERDVQLRQNMLPIIILFPTIYFFVCLLLLMFFLTDFSCQPVWNWFIFNWISKLLYTNPMMRQEQSAIWFWGFYNCWTAIRFSTPSFAPKPFMPW